MATRLSNSSPDADGALAHVLWPRARLGEAIHALARSAGLPTTCAESFVPLSSLTSDQLAAWIDAAAERGGIEARNAIAAMDDIPALIRRGAPLLLRVRTGDGEQFLAVARGHRHAVSVVGPDLRVHRVAVTTVCQLVQRPFEQAVATDVDQLLERMRVSSRRRIRARRALIAERLKDVRLNGCWLLRLPPGGPIRAEAREIRIHARVAGLVCAHLIQYVLFVLSWWLLGRGVLRGTVDRGWLFGWVLLLVSLVPFRLWATWSQGVVSTTVGAALRRRLLRGALQIDREVVRRKGAGELFGLVMESAAVESLALSGGLMACFSLLELVIAGAVLWTGAAPLPGVLLGFLAMATAWLGIRYVRTRQTWTTERLSMTRHLLESMLGHRTRLAQQPVDEWHPEEDSSLTRYLASGSDMDRASVWLTAVMPRAWLMLALAALAPAVVGHAAPERIAITIGGILLAYRSLRRWSSGLSNLAGAAIAGKAMLPLARAAGRHELPGHPSMAVIPDRGAPRDGLAIHARELMFRYPGQAEPVLQGCTLAVPRGARILMEGASGAGKSTLVSILAGLETAQSGLLLVDGLDRSVLGKAGWRRRIVLAPQAYENYLVSASLAFNLLMGCRWPAHRTDLVEAEEVCRELGLGELLDSLPGGLHQMVGETGWQLSQGERARVFLARALLQKPEVLVLDESFSALDPDNVDRAIRCVLRRTETVIAVAHT